MNCLLRHVRFQVPGEMQKRAEAFQSAFICDDASEARAVISAGKVLATVFGILIPIMLILLVYMVATDGWLSTLPLIFLSILPVVLSIGVLFPYLFLPVRRLRKMVDCEDGERRSDREIAILRDGLSYASWVLWQEAAFYNAIIPQITRPDRSDADGRLFELEAELSGLMHEFDAELRLYEERWEEELQNSRPIDDTQWPDAFRAARNFWLFVGSTELIAKEQLIPNEDMGAYLHERLQQVENMHQYWNVRTLNMDV